MRARRVSCRRLRLGFACIPAGLLRWLCVGPPSMGEITYSTPCGKFLPIFTPILTRKGEKVIIAVRVQPCQKK